MSYSDIPEELRVRKQWVCWRYTNIGAAKPTKVPYSPAGKLANVNDPSTWGTFEETAFLTQYDGIGFVFTYDDPYTFIDLDEPTDSNIAERQIKIAQAFDSYSEISPSGKGLHIIVKGQVHKGRRRDCVEIYSSQRYATFTGNVYNNSPIRFHNELLNLLWEEMSEPPITAIYDGNQEQLNEDAEIIRLASTAANSDKFNRLKLGKWQDYYSSQSEADFAFIDIISFYTKNRNQITRIFRQSALGARPKAKRDNYVNAMISRSFDQTLPPMDMEGWKIGLEHFQLGNKHENRLNLDNTNPINNVTVHDIAVSSNGKTTAFDAENVGSTPATATIRENKREALFHLNRLEREFKQPERSPVSLPPGLMGELAQFIYQAAPQPIPEVALAAAIGLMAGVCGRAYNVSNTGLNQYILLLAKTGIGKEAMSSGIDKLMNAIKLQVPTANEFIGPSYISSGQALVKYIHKKSQCFVSILGEFGLRIQRMSSDRASTHEAMLKQILLEVYQKSGHSDNYRAQIYADLDKNTEVTSSPAFSLLGESTPHHFYSALTEEMIVEGLMPRFLLIEYNGKRPPLNKYHADVQPSNFLIDQFASLVANCSTIMHHKRVVKISFDDEAQIVADNFGQYATDQINSTNDEVVLNLWNRAHLKAIKLAGLVAVGVNLADPVIKLDHIKWAIDMVTSDIVSLSAKFETGHFGASSSEIKQIEAMKKAIVQYINLNHNELEKYKIKEVLFENKIIPYDYISRRLIASSTFRLDRLGATAAIKRCLQTLSDSDIIREIGRTDLIQKYGTTQRAFMLTDFRILKE